MSYFDKNKIKESLSLQDIYTLINDFGGEPEQTKFGLISTTICHNLPGYGSRKLYYYENSHLFQCYTGCNESFDIFELIIKVYKVQFNKQINLNNAIYFIIKKFNLSTEFNNDDFILEYNQEDWRILDNYSKLSQQNQSNKNIILKEYDKKILNYFNYSVKIYPWLNEGISQEAINLSKIGYYPGGAQITIPHFDINNRFIGLRGRTLIEDEELIYGKYRPIKINGILYAHPLSMNLYNLNFSKENIKKIKKAIIFEGEKSTLQYKSFFGLQNDISVACCGSNLSQYQIELLISLGVEEIIIGFDRQFQTIGDKEFLHLKDNLLKIRNKYKNYVLISFLFDKNMILSYKASPTDEGKDKFLQLFQERIIL